MKKTFSTFQHKRFDQSIMDLNWCWKSEINQKLGKTGKE